MGFEITHSRLKRAGLDYWKYVNVTTYPDSATFFSTLDQEASSWFFTTKAQKLYFDVRFSAQDWLFFGAETKGLPADLLAKAPERCLKIPLLDNRVRSLNLANSVAATLYEALRQIHFS
jgi:tRNA (cytidine/uridine-2'-O-)-methyltransferase